MGTWQSSGRGFLTLWPPIQSWLDFHAQWKWIQKANESGLHAFILSEANLDAQSCFHNAEKPFKMFFACKHGHMIPYRKAKRRLDFGGYLKCPQLKEMRKILAGAFFPQNTATPLSPEKNCYYISAGKSCPWQRGWAWWSLRSLATILWFCGICTENILEEVFTVLVNVLFLRITAWLYFSSSNTVYLHWKTTSHISSFVQTNTDNHRASLHFQGKNNTLICLCWGKMSVQGCK